ncbi:MAG: HDOD domain-containing protein [Desulfarculus sp.]|nr:HDOD domain-containing protein [Desulfarculus sp.]
MTRILFVDDESKILDGLRRMLRGMRQQWEMVFVEGGALALDLLAREHFDIVVTDMRMPGMDGVALLSQVRQLYPHMARIILSGHSDQEVVMKSVRLAHQYLAKPCDHEKLQKVLQQAASMRQFLVQDNLISLVTQIEALPSMPATHTRLLEALDAEDGSLEKIGQLISQDMGMTALMLKLVNSAFFGLQRHIASPQQAVALLGLEIIRGLVLSQGLFNALEPQQFPGMSFQELWRHSLAVGAYAKTIVQLEGEDQTLVDNAFIAGMLHDVGKLVLATVARKEYIQVIQAVRQQDRLVAAVELEVLGTSHARAGAYLMGLWGLSEEIVVAVALHNKPVFTSSSGGRKGRLLLAAVHAANVLEHELCVIHPGYARPKLDRGFMAEANLIDNVPHWRQACQQISTWEGANGTV